MGKDRNGENPVEIRESVRYNIFCCLDGDQRIERTDEKEYLSRDETRNV